MNGDRIWSDQEARAWLRGLRGDEARMYFTEPAPDEPAAPDEPDEPLGPGDPEENPVDEDGDEEDVTLASESAELQQLAEVIAGSRGQQLAALSGDALMQVYQEAAQAQATLRRAERALGR